MEFFLNNVEEKLIESPLEWKSLKLAYKISGAKKFISDTEEPITVTVFLCDSYHDANEIAKENSFPDSPKAKWSVNGDLLYIVESADESKVSDILSFFAGKE